MDNQYFEQNHVSRHFTGAWLPSVTRVCPPDIGALTIGVCASYRTSPTAIWPLQRDETYPIANRNGNDRAGPERESRNVRDANTVIILHQVCRYHVSNFICL